MPEEDKKHNWFITLMILCVVAVIAWSFYVFFFQKNYDFIVETDCDPLKEVCLQRDCSNPEDCPPNELVIFKRYSLNANDFQSCENEDCTEACLSGAIECELLECVEDPDYGETCTDPQAFRSERALTEDNPAGDLIEETEE